MNDIDLSPEALERLKTLAQKATPGPWIDYEGSIYQENEGCFWIADVGRTIEDRQEERAYIIPASSLPCARRSSGCGLKWPASKKRRTGWRLCWRTQAVVSL